MLKFTVEHQTITKVEDFAAASDSIEYLRCEFTFSDDWTEQPFAIFKGSGACIKQAIIDGVCFVPWEVLTKPGYIYISCYAGQRITSNIVSVYVNASGYCEADNEHEPTPEVYEQLIAYFDQVKDDIEDITDQAVTDMTALKDEAITETTAIKEAAVAETTAIKEAAIAATELIKDQAEDAADRAEQSAAVAGYMFFHIDERGHLIYEHTTNVQVDFYLQDGRLFVKAVA